MNLNDPFRLYWIPLCVRYFPFEFDILVYVVFGRQPLPIHSDLGALSKFLCPLRVRRVSALIYIRGDIASNAGVCSSQLCAPWQILGYLHIFSNHVPPYSVVRGKVASRWVSFCTYDVAVLLKYRQVDSRHFCREENASSNAGNSSAYDRDL